MLRYLVACLLTYPVGNACWAIAQFERNTDLQKDTRSISSITDIIPKLENLDCIPRCVGGAECVRHTDMDSCLALGSLALGSLALGSQKGCFWSCE